MGRRAKRLLALLAAVCVFTVLFAVYVFGIGPETPLSGTRVGPSGGDVLLLAPGGYTVQNQDGTGTLTIPGSTSGIAWEAPLLGAAYRDRHIVVFLDEYTYLSTAVYNYDLEVTGSYITDLLIDELALYDCTADGSVYAVCAEDENVLCYRGADESTEDIVYESPIRMVHVTENGQLWVATDSGYYAGDARDPYSPRLISGGVPYRVLCANTFMDASGAVWRIGYEEAGLKGLDPDGLCSADEEGVVYADDTGRIHKVLWDNEELGSCITSGEPKALTATGVLYQEGGTLYYAQLDFTPPEAPEPTPSLEPAPTPSLEPEPSLEPTPSLEPEPSVTPSLEPTPSPSPTPVEKPDWLDKDRRDGYFYISGAIPANELQNEFGPQEFLLKTAEGEMVADNSLLATGMTVHWGKLDGEENQARIIVWGDCTGDGRITRPDMEQAQRILLGEPAEE